MPDSTAMLILVIAATIFTLIWGKLLWFFDEKSQALSNLVFRMMSHSKMSFQEIKSLLLILIYSAFGILGTVSFAAFYDLKVLEMFTFDALTIPLILLGIAAQISLTGFLSSSCAKIWVRRGINPFTEIKKIPWVTEVGKLPGYLRPGTPGFVAFFEEFFFRGILLLIMVNKLAIMPWLALSTVTVLFILEQSLQLKTIVQATMLSCSSLAISAVGGLLVLYTDSILPAALAHASFMIFYRHTLDKKNVAR